MWIEASWTEARKLSSRLSLSGGGRREVFEFIEKPLDLIASVNVVWFRAVMIRRLSV
jgi:hypothetical protein